MIVLLQAVMDWAERNKEPGVHFAAVNCLQQFNVSAMMLSALGSALSGIPVEYRVQRQEEARQEGRQPPPKIIRPDLGS